MTRQIVNAVSVWKLCSSLLPVEKMSFSVSCFLCVHGADRWQVKSKMTTCSTGRKTERTKCTATLTAAFLEPLLMLRAALIVYPHWVFVVWKMLSVPETYYRLSTVNLIPSGWKWRAAFTVPHWPSKTHACVKSELPFVLTCRGHCSPAVPAQLPQYIQQHSCKFRQHAQNYKL